MNNQDISRNIRILSLLSFMSNLWFWFGIWVLYYLLFTNYAGIGLVETFMIISITFFEVPSGAFADLFGKKRTLMIAFLITAIAEMTMGFAISFPMLMIAAFIGSISTTLVSGTFEAITFDTLKKLKREKEYENIYARQKSYSYIASVVATIIGGLLYKYVDPRAPFFAVACANIVALCIAGFLVEPRMKKVAVTLQSYKKQLREGAQQLFAQSEIRGFTILALLAGITPVFMYEMLSDLLFVQYGQSPISISIAIIITFTAAAISVRMASRYMKKIGFERMLIILSLAYAALLIVVPLVNFVGAIIIVSCLASLNGISSVIRSRVLNMNISSEFRTTALSTFAMLLSVPYVFSAVLLGYLSDQFTVQNVILVLGVNMVILILLGIAYRTYICHIPAKNDEV